jgi:hypothetical protein
MERGEGRFRIIYLLINVSFETLGTIGISGGMTVWMLMVHPALYWPIAESASARSGRERLR